jgi:hypothetical protein
MASQVCAKGKSAQGWQDGVVRWIIVCCFWQAKGALGAVVFEVRVWAESLLCVLEC